MRRPSRPAAWARVAASLPARLTGPDRAVLAVWAASRFATYLAAWAGGLVLAGAPALGTGAAGSSYAERWLAWDAVHYAAIAEHGYDDPTGATPLVAFFPGLPALLRAGHVVGLGSALAGLVVSALALAVAAVALARLADLDDSRAGGPAVAGSSTAGLAAVVGLVAAPSAVFLAAGYSEAVFLACAVPAWLAARRGRWWLAGLLGAGASTTRVSGLFLAAGLAVLFLTTGGFGRRWRQAPALVLPVLPQLAYSAWLGAAKGDWLAWWHAQQQGWYRALTDPATAFERTWAAAFGGAQPPEVALVFRLELAAGLLGLAVTVALLVAHRWGEATYVGLTLAALLTSTWWISVARASLLWFPAWLLLGRLVVRRRWVLLVYLAVSVPLAVVLTIAFVTGRWAG